jgi:cation:H+ antiporter
VFLWIRIRDARGDAGKALESDARAVIEAHGSKSRGIMVSIVLVFAGAGLLTLGAEILVRGAIFIARDQGISERIIALTLVSAGTGLPELATAIVAGIRRQMSVAIGNVIGSNIFNMFGILGTVAMAYPPIKANPRIIHEDAFWMLGISLFLLLPVLKRGRNLSRLEGAILLAAYTGYLVWLIRTAGAGS